MNTYPIVILFSGNGSNMESLYKNLHHRYIEDWCIEIPMVFTNNPHAFGIKRAEKLGVECKILCHKNYKNRAEYDQHIIDIIQPYNPKICLLAGYMRILSEVFIKSFLTINIHPSLLPLFKGANAIKESFESDMKIAGVTVHYVSKELDSGAIIAQEAFYRKDYETFEKFENKIHSIEHKLYPHSVFEVIQNTIKLS